MKVAARNELRAVFLFGMMQSQRCAYPDDVEHFPHNSDFYHPQPFT